MTLQLESLDPWIALFPLESFELWEWGSPGAIVGPVDLALVEQVRTRVAAKQTLGRTVATDVFLFGLGEPMRRDTTKVGGLPYRPIDVPWPQLPTGEPYTFLAQFRFSESKDIVGEVPGDVLLVFTQGHDLAWPRVGEFVFEWYPLGIETLVDSRSVPRPAWEFVVCYGVRYRTVDYIEERACEAIIEFLISQGAAEDEFDAEIGASVFCRLCGMKIGGVPFLIPEGVSGKVDVEHDLPGKFLCTLSDIGPSIESAYPWINEPEPIQSKKALQKLMVLNWRDGAVLNFSLDKEGQVHWVAQFW